MIGNILLFISRASASAERVNEVLDTNIDIKNADNPDFTPLSSGDVTFENVSFGYSGDKNQLVLKEISFQVPRRVRLLLFLALPAQANPHWSTSYLAFMTLPVVG